MTLNYSKKWYIELLDKYSKGKFLYDSELANYSCKLEQQIEWELREQYLELIEDCLKDKISSAEFFADLRAKNYSVINIVKLLESHRIILSLNKKVPKFSELMEPIIDELSYTGDDFTNFLEENFIKIKNYLDEKYKFLLPIFWVASLALFTQGIVMKLY